MAKATRLIRPRTVTGDGEGLVSHAGLVWLGEVADRSGLTVGFSQVLASAPRRPARVVMAQDHMPERPQRERNDILL